MFSEKTSLERVIGILAAVLEGGGGGRREGKGE